MATERIPIACTLSPGAAVDQSAEWRRLRAAATTTETINNGVALTFAADLAPTVEDLAAREQACCAFLSLDTTRKDGTIRLDITSDDPDAQPVIAHLAGTASP